MDRMTIAAACCAWAAATAAGAQVTNVTGASATQVQLDSTFNSTGSGPGLVTQGGGAAYYSSYSSTPTVISFESGAASIRGDNQVSTTSTSSVDITIKNGGATAVDALMQSQITAAGLGLYLANTAGGCGGSGLFAGGDPYGGCAQTKGPLTFYTRPAGAGAGRFPLAGASFEFSVTVGGTQVYDFTGQETMTLNPATGRAEVNPLVLSDPSVLQGLTHIQPGNPGSADGYTWDASDVSIGLGSLAAGASEDVVYSATVSTFSNVKCATADPTVCLVPFAAFGDPIGGGQGVKPAVARLFGQGLDASPLADGSDGIPYVDDWAPQTFRFPTFDFKTGVLSFNTGVPEPKTWMSLILGFGLIGAALRRRRVLSYT
jgi:hypothetical protein